MALLFGPEKFEAGSPGAFDAVDSEGWGLADAALDTTSKVEATNSIIYTATGEGAARAEEDLGSGYSDLYFQLKGFFPTGWAFGASSYTGFFVARNAGDSSSILWFNIEDYGSIRITANGTMGYTNTGIDIPINSVFTLEFRIKISATVGNISIWLNNTTEGSPDYNSGNINTGTTNFQVIKFGNYYAPEAHSSFYLDFISMDTAFIGTRSSTTTRIQDIIGIGILPFAR